MVGLDENALICDFAEVYHVYDWRALPLKTAATLAMGLRPDSRVIQKMSGLNWPINTLLLALMIDSLQSISWQLTPKEGRRGRKPPKSLARIILGETEERETEGFDSIEEFRRWRASMLEE